jgi:DNA-binding NarL/FixJ family response regulator
MKILLADDHTIFRQALRALLEKHSEHIVIGEADDGTKAVAMALEHTPNIVIMDVSMMNMNGIEATRILAHANQSIKVIALSMHSDKHLVLKMLHAGAKAYLQKDCAAEELFHAITIVSHDKIYISPQLQISELQPVLEESDIARLVTSTLLTVKEREVLQRVAEGKPTKQIAIDLTVSTKTIEKHRQRIMEKLNIHSVAELTKYAIREGITSIEH